jgi:RNA polymerase sigma-70 factor (ECF subfamily)
MKEQILTRLKTLSSSPTYERDVAIFWLYYEQGYTAKEISLLPTVQLTVKGVESTLLRLTRFIRDQGGAAGAAAKPEG